jgi:hypothetical protein
MVGSSENGLMVVSLVIDSQKMMALLFDDKKHQSVKKKSLTGGWRSRQNIAASERILHREVFYVRQTVINVHAI